MAKQTFTTGQVLTAAQMTSLQQTAMLGGAASAKTASYTLVAADAGTAISMSNASATTITVNTALFAAGDTVQITNLGAGICTITAGTATVNTSASLALAQYESGTLDFVSTSSAIFIKGAGAAAASGGMTLINSGGTTLTGGTVTIGSIPSTYKNLQLVVVNADPTNNGATFLMRINGNTSTTYISDLSSTNLGSFSSSSITLNVALNSTTTQGLTVVNFYDYANATTFKMGDVLSINNDFTTATSINYSFTGFAHNQTTAITSISLFTSSSGTWAGGTAYLYGVQ